MAPFKKPAHDHTRKPANDLNPSPRKKTKYTSSSSPSQNAIPNNSDVSVITTHDKQEPARTINAETCTDSQTPIFSSPAIYSSREQQMICNLHGTIVVALKYNNGEGVILASDSRGTYNRVPVDENVDKVFIHGNIIFGGAGSVEAYMSALSRLYRTPADATFSVVVAHMKNFMNQQYPRTQNPRVNSELVLCGHSNGVISIRTIKRESNTGLFVIQEKRTLTAIGTGARYARPILMRGNIGHEFGQAWSRAKLAMFTAMVRQPNMCGGRLDLAFLRMPAPPVLRRRIVNHQRVLDRLREM